MVLSEDQWLGVLSVAFAFYGLLFVPFFCSKLFVRFDSSVTELFWFIIVVFLNAYVLLYVLARSKYRSKFLVREKIYLVAIILGYIFFLVPIWILMDMG